MVLRDFKFLYSTGDREIDARGPKKKKNKKTKKKKPKTRKDRTICTNSNEGDGSWQICTKPRNNPARKNNPSPAETSNTAASSNNPGPQPPRLCEPDLGWKNSVCPGFPGEPGTCSTHKPSCGRHDVPVPTSPIDTRKQFVEPPKREARVSVKGKEMGEKKKDKETTQEKPKDPCNSDWCPGNSAGSCSTNKPQCTGGGTSRRSYSTAAVMRPREYSRYMVLHAWILRLRRRVRIDVTFFILSRCRLELYNVFVEEFYLRVYLVLQRSQNYRSYQRGP